jgi:hypothetical protein
MYLSLSDKNNWSSAMLFTWSMRISYSIRTELRYLFLSEYLTEGRGGDSNAILLVYWFPRQLVMKFLAITLLLVLTFPSFVFANIPVSVTLDGTPVVFHDQGPTIIDGRTLVPVRGVFEDIGFEVGWNDATRTATLTNDEHVVVITIGSANFTTNGVTQTLDVPAQIIGERTLLPIRAVLESVGFFVGWREVSRTVLVSSTPLIDGAIAWRVQPTLDYESIRMCNCGMFFEGSGWNAIDPVTGQRSGTEHAGHGGAGPNWVYDPVRNLFGHSSYGEGYHRNIGLFPLNEFESGVRGMNLPHSDWLLSTTDRFLLVQSIDSSLPREGDWDNWYLPSEAFSGRYALMYNRELVTDFIYDGGQPWWHDFTFNDADTGRRLTNIPVSWNGDWGMLDQTGNIVLPFMFENIVRIDEDTAFARFEGRYGILDLRESMFQ